MEDAIKNTNSGKITHSSERQVHVCTICYQLERICPKQTNTIAAIHAYAKTWITSPCRVVKLAPPRQVHTKSSGEVVDDFDHGRIAEPVTVNNTY